MQGTCKPSDTLEREDSDFWHGGMTHGFPSLFLIGLYQGGGTNTG